MVILIVMLSYVNKRFLYDNGLHHERVKRNVKRTLNTSIYMITKIVVRLLKEEGTKKKI